jgi:hypothetical protein
MLPMSTLQLIPHPSTPCDFVRSLTAQMQSRGAALRLTYAVAGDVQRVAVPESRPPARTDGLWRFTCFEIFLRPAGSAAYQEFNFSPSGEWAAYSFTGYRQGMKALAQPFPPRIECVRTQDSLEIEVDLHAPLLAHPNIRAALAAVLQHGDGHVSYWALAHPAAKPDFHDAAGFIAESWVLRSET